MITHTLLTIFRTAPIIAVAILLSPLATLKAWQGSITVPNLIGLSVPQAVRVVADAGLLFSGDSAQPFTAETKVAVNRVSSQEPAAGQQVAPGSPVRVIVVRNPNVKLVFDATSLSFVNTGEQPLDLSGITLESGEGKDFSQFRARDWDKTLGPKSCHQIWTSRPQAPTRPPECAGVVKSNIISQKNKLFWLSGPTSFRIRNYGDTIATCSTASGSCDLALPQGGDLEQTSYLYFAYRTTYLTIRNQSERWMSLENVEIVAADSKRFNPDIMQNIAPGDVLWAGHRLAPGQCIVYSALDVGALPPYDCTVVGYVKLPEQAVFWTARFSIASLGSPQSSTCPPPLPGQLSICIRSR